MSSLLASMLGSLVVAVLAPLAGSQATERPAHEPAAETRYEAAEALELVLFALREEGRDGARAMLQDVVPRLARPEAGEPYGHLGKLQELDRLAEDLESLPELRLLREAVLATREELSPPDDRSVLMAKLNLGWTRYELGDLAGAHELFEAVHATWTRLLPADHADLLWAQVHLATTRRELGDLHGALALEEAVHRVRARELPADHPDLLVAKQNLALTRKALGDLRGALELEQTVHEARSRLFPADDLELLKAKQNLGETLLQLGDLRGAQELLEVVHEAFSRLLPADHHLLLLAKQNLAVTRSALGDLHGARALEEAVLEARGRLLPADHPDLLSVRQNLAATRSRLGDLLGARALEEAVLEVRERLLPADHPDLLDARQNLAVTRAALGDRVGARELEEAVLEARARLLPPDHPDLLAAMQNLAATQGDLGDLAGARELDEAVLAARARALPPDHPDLLITRKNLAIWRKGLGDLEGARELEEAVLEAWTRLLPPDHPYLLAVKGNLAATRAGLGDLAGALELDEAVLAARTRLLPPDHPDLLAAQLNLAVTRQRLCDGQGARALFASLLEGQRLRARTLPSEAARLAREGARAELQRLFRALGPATGSGLEPELFATLEELRLASMAGAEAAHAIAERPELAELARGAADARARLNDHAAAGPPDGTSVEAWREDLLALAEERDRAEHALRRALAETGAFVGKIDAGGVAARLAPGAALASFLRYPRWLERDLATSGPLLEVDSLLAFLVLPDGAVRRIELGPAAEIEALVRDWRASLGRPLAGRGVEVAGARSGAEPLDALGARLRERILDPIRTAVPGLTSLHVVLDDVLHLVPLDALPLEDGLVGERIAIRNEVTLARLLGGRRDVAAEGVLTAAGGIDYQAELGAQAPARLQGATPPVEAGTRSGAAGFLPLPETSGEIASIAALYRGAFEREASVLSGSGVTKAALFAAAPRTRYLHLATHGWFASESFRSQLDALAEPGSRLALERARETLVGFAPETLCGLALAGANRGKDVLGRVPGILTAEELASFDLRCCELAVLSACETNVGIRRAGQGIQSLQTALHAAGARTAITSLWKVDDAATRRLFELFYTKLWEEELPKADALWQAKRALRDEGAPVRDWAAWVLTGDPD